MMNNLFPKNTHKVERILRVIIGLAVLSLVFVGPKSFWGLLGLVPLMTGIMGSCPLYTVLGVNTCRIGQSGKSRPKTAETALNSGKS